MMRNMKMIIDLDSEELCFLEDYLNWVLDSIDIGTFQYTTALKLIKKIRKNKGTYVECLVKEKNEKK